jgi:ABC-type sugar transport system ATPase subunit
MIYVTHDQTEAMTLGQRVAVLDRGVLQQVAPPRELYERPANVFVARFIGTPAMNVFRSRVRARGSRFLAVARHAGSCASSRTSRCAARSSRCSETRSRSASVPSTSCSQSSMRNGVIDAGVEHVEPLGHETLARLDVSGEKLFMRIAECRGSKAGSRARLLEPSALHFFDADGRALK